MAWFRSCGGVGRATDGARAKAARKNSRRKQITSDKRRSMERKMILLLIKCSHQQASARKADLNKRERALWPWSQAALSAEGNLQESRIRPKGPKQKKIVKHNRIPAIKKGMNKEHARTN